ncbi:MAG: pitrilysin family protein [Candidatus Saccharimonadales bacterium]
MMRHYITELELKNGVKGLLINIPDASVMSFNFGFRAGDYYAPKDKLETAHLMEHLILGANEKFPRARDFQADIQRNGAYSNASTGIYDINYEAECADFEWKRILDRMILSLTRPLFLEDEFIAEFGNVKEELISRSNNHYSHLSLALRESYDLKSVTTFHKRYEVIENVKLDDVVNHYKNTHYAKNMRFIIAGKLNPNRKRHIKSVLNDIDLPGGSEGRKKLPKQIPKTLKKPVFIENDTVENFYFYFDTFVRRRMNDKEIDSMNLLNSILTETLHSKILGTAREQGLVYGMSSNINYDNNYTNWWFGSQVRPQNAAPLFEIIIEELQKVFNGSISQEDIKAAKQYRLGQFQRSAQTVNGIAAGYLYRYFFDETIDNFYDTPGKIRAVTKPKIVRAASDLFDDKIWGIGVLGGSDKQVANKLSKQIEVLWG